MEETMHQSLQRNQCVAVCCSVLQCVAVCCSVLQCVAVCCSVLQCVAVTNYLASFTHLIATLFLIATLYHPYTRHTNYLSPVVPSCQLHILCTHLIATIYHLHALDSNRLSYRHVIATIYHPDTR